MFDATPLFKKGEVVDSRAQSRMPWRGWMSPKTTALERLKVVGFGHLSRKAGHRHCHNTFTAIQNHVSQSYTQTCTNGISIRSNVLDKLTKRHTLCMSWNLLTPILQLKVKCFKWSTEMSLVNTIVRFYCIKNPIVYIRLCRSIVLSKALHRCSPVCGLLLPKYKNMIETVHIFLLRRLRFRCKLDRNEITLPAASSLMKLQSVRTLFPVLELALRLTFSIWDKRI